MVRLANQTSALIERTAGQTLPRVRATAVEIVHNQYGGAYGRETAAARVATAKFRAATGVDLISVGAITNSAPVLDIGLDLER